MTQGFLFELNLDENNDPLENTEVFPAIIYFSREEHEQFKNELKIAIKKLFPQDYQDKNGSDVLLSILKKFNNAENI